MDELLGAPLPRETEATCSDCAMLPAPDAEPVDGTFFEAATKCCTYLPSLANFLVGRVLAGEEGPGRRSLEDRIDARLGVTPIGVGMSPAYYAQYKEAALHGFGRTPALRCPHLLDDGQCGIWLHRNAICSTWYCKHVRGGTAERFWQDGIAPLLSAVEDTLARHCVAELDIGDAALLELFPRPRQLGDSRSFSEPRFDRVDGASYAKRWGPWRDREREMYMRSAQIVERLSWGDILAIAGPNVRLLASSARSLHRAVRSRALPPSLTVGEFRIVSAGPDTLQIEGYSSYDPIEVPSDLLAVIHRFDGGSTKAARAAIAKDGLEVDDDLLRTLIDFGVLIDASE